MNKKVTTFFILMLFNEWLYTKIYTFTGNSKIVTIDCQFRFWRTACNGTAINADTLFFTGAELRDISAFSDVALLELTNPPGVGDGVNYAGWNRQTGEPSDDWSYIVQHPRGADMRFTRTRNVKTYTWNSSY